MCIPAVLCIVHSHSLSFQNQASLVWHNFHLLGQFRGSLNIGVVHFMHHLTYRIMLLCYGLKAIKAAELEV